MMALADMAMGVAIASIRPGAALFASPLFGNTHVPMTLRVGLSVALGWSAYSTLDPALVLAAVHDAPFLVLPELVVGLAMGFAMHMAFGAAMMAGEVIGNTMGLGFATSADGLTGPAPTLSNLMGFTTTAIFLAGQGHLTLIASIIGSYRLLPLGAGWMPSGDMIGFGSLMFGGAVAIALPVAFALVLVQIITALIARAAPSLNLFAIGLPFTQLAGAALLIIAFPTMGSSIALRLTEALALARP